MKTFLVILLLLLTPALYAVETIKVGVILAESKNIAHDRNVAINRPYGFTLTDWDRMFFDTTGAYFDTVTVDGTPRPDSAATFGSLSDYWWKTSSGNVRIVGNICNPESASTGTPLWIKLDSSYAYYSTDDHRGEVYYEALYKACELGYFDSTYDYICVLNNVTGGGGLSSGFIAPEVWGPGGMVTLGMFAHESGHSFFEFADYYWDPNAPRNKTALMHDLMSTGLGGISYAGISSPPAYPSPHLRVKSGWLPPDTISTGRYRLLIPYNPDTAALKMITFPNSTTTYILESRGRLNYDEYAPNPPSNFAAQPGVLLIWAYYQYSQPDAYSADIDLIEADNNGSTPGTNDAIAYPTDFWPMNGDRQNWNINTTPKPLYDAVGALGGGVLSDAPFALYGIRDTVFDGLRGTIIDTVAFAPKVTTGLASATQTSITFSGTVNPNALSTLVRLYWKGDTVGIAFHMDSVGTYTNITTQSFSKIKTGLTPNMRYFYYFTGQNAVGTGTGLTDLITNTNATGTNLAVTTTSPQSITSTSAVLRGTVMADNAFSTVWFVMGETKGVYTTSDTTESVSGITVTPVSFSKTGLTPATKYYYRARASNAAVRLLDPPYRQGVEDSVSTDVAVLAPVVVTQAATSITQTTAILHGNVNPGNAPDSARFVWGVAPSTYIDSAAVVWGIRDENGNASVSKAITGLSSGTTYYFRLRAYNSAAHVAGSELSFETSVSTQVPTVTVNAVDSVGLTGARISGVVNAGNLSTTVTFRWRISGSTDTTSVPATPATATGTSNTAVLARLTGLTSGGLYYYTIRAQNSLGATQPAELSFVATSITPPSITADSTTGIGLHSVTFHATLNPHNSSTIVWLLLRNGETEGTYLDSIPFQTPEYTGDTVYHISKTIDTLDAGTLYYWEVHAKNTGGSTHSAESTFTTLIAVPKLLSQTATLITLDSVRFSCSYTPNGDSTLVAFVVRDFIQDSLGWGGTILALGYFPKSTTSVSGTLGDLEPGEEYHVRVALSNSRGGIVGPWFTFETVVATLTRFVLIGRD